MIDREELRVYLASAPQRKHKIVTIQIYHPNMTKTYYTCNEPYPITAMANGEMREHEVTGYLLELASSDGTLDQNYTLSFDMVDRENEFREQLALIPLPTKTMVEFTIREFLSDRLDDPLSEVVVRAATISYTRGAASFALESPRITRTSTGRVYTPRDISSMRGFL